MGPRESVSQSGQFCPIPTEPMVACDINGETHMLMADTGATYSCLWTLHPLSRNRLSVIGVSGMPQQQTFTVPLAVRCGNQSLTHQFLYAVECSVNLLGRDLLGKLRFNIYCNPNRLCLTTEPLKFDIFPKLLYVAPTPKEEELYTRVYGYVCFLKERRLHTFSLNICSGNHGFRLFFHTNHH